MSDLRLGTIGSGVIVHSILKNVVRTEGIRLDEIKKITGSDIRTVRFNERGDLVATVGK